MEWHKSHEVTTQEVFDSEQWLNEFKSTIPNKVFNNHCTLRTQIQISTLDCLSQYSYIPAPNKRITFSKKFVLEQVRKTVMQDSLPELEKSPNFETEYFVQNMDCLVAVRNLLNEEMENENYDGTTKIACLNMASSSNPGGGYMGGAGAQEENLFRRTNLFQLMSDKKLIKQRSYRYPLNDATLYCPNAIVFRDSEANGYKFLEKPYLCNFLCTAGLKRPETEIVDGKRYLVKRAIQITKRRIKIMLATAAKNKNEILVLSAIGCGEFRNPPHHIAKLFYEVLNSEMFKGYFKKVCFAIIEDHNSKRRHNKEGNILPFKRVFLPSECSKEELNEKKSENIETKFVKYSKDISVSQQLVTEKHQKLSKSIKKEN
ncbi:hypothetical protein M0812_13754 [Anaeramoeba flamelloides]|uniref:Microbial-type PARG catalytic domain-containing protein n=1 Tax=Anaeramoeba flamelloides TaxID=1746091 RepID=A0AAV7ZKE4_9EUKA|nr:hypothetical protein M0812_13754 [Anaeramoeba flamelloides]